MTKLRTESEILHRLKTVTKLLQDDTLSDEAKIRLQQCRCDCKWFLSSARGNDLWYKD